MAKQNQWSQTRLDSMRADVCLIKAYPFNASIWEMAHCTSCVFKCVCVHPSPHRSLPSLLASALYVSLSESDKNKQSSLISAYTHTNHPPIHQPTHTMHIFHSQTPTPPTHARTLSQTCIWHTKPRRTHI